MATVEYQQLYSDAIQTPLLLSNTKKMQKRRTFFPQLALFTPQSPSSLLADTLWILAGFSHSLIATCMDVNRRRQEISFVIEGSARSLDFSTLNPDNIVEFMDTPESKEALQGQLDVINAVSKQIFTIVDCCIGAWLLIYCRTTETRNPDQHHRFHSRTAIKPLKRNLHPQRCPLPRLPLPLHRPA